MRLEKKRVLKEDGRYLVYYHSAESASEEQRKAFEEIAAEAVTVGANCEPTAESAGKASAEHV